MIRIARVRLAVIVLSGFACACSQSESESVETESVVQVETMPVTVGTVRGVIHATGVVAPAPGADLLVVAPQPGRILEMPKAEGDRVQRGDLLVRFEIPAITADVAAKAADVARAQAQVTNAKAAYTRAHDLFDRGVAARKEVEDADRAIADAEAALAEARAAHAAAELVAERSAVRATFDGVIAKRAHNPGELVEATASDWLLRVIDPRRLEVSALVPVSDVQRVKLGASARIAGASGAGAPTLRVVSRPAAVDTGTAAVPVRLSFLEPPGLPTGLAVQVEIDAEVHRDVLMVPVGAIVREGTETSVFVAAEGKAHRTAVSLGLADAEHVEVLSGVKAGDAVVVSGHNGLPDGASVKTAATTK